MDTKVEIVEPDINELLELVEIEVKQAEEK